MSLVLTVNNMQGGGVRTLLVKDVGNQHSGVQETQNRDGFRAGKGGRYPSRLYMVDLLFRRSCFFGLESA